MRASAKALQTLHERRHDDAEWLVLLLDGKAFADDQVVIALGVTTTGEKRILGLVQITTENKRVIAAFLRELVERGFQTPTGLLVVLDGAKGLSAAVRDVFGEHPPIQGGPWHKRENVLSYLAKTQHARWRRKLQGLTPRPPTVRPSAPCGSSSRSWIRTTRPPRAAVKGHQHLALLQAALRGKLTAPLTAA